MFYYFYRGKMLVILNVGSNIKHGRMYNQLLTLTKIFEFNNFKILVFICDDFIENDGVIIILL